MPLPTVTALNENTFLIQIQMRRCFTYAQPTIVKEENKEFSFKWQFSNNNLVLTDVRLGSEDILSCKNTAETIKCICDGVLYDMVETNSTWESKIGKSLVHICVCVLHLIIVFKNKKSFSQPSIIMEHLASLLEKATLSDIEFVIDGEKLAAHRLIVAAGSPVLADLLKNNDKEKTREIVPIEGTTVAAFRQFLRYLYTGVCLEMDQEGMAEQLFLLADCYAVDSLKEECAFILMNSLTINNAVKTLILAHRHPSQELFQGALMFISKNSQAICSGVEWSNLRKDYPDLCFQALDLSVQSNIKGCCLM